MDYWHQYGGGWWMLSSIAQYREGEGSYDAT
jgi:hypothetical protein